MVDACDTRQVRADIVEWGTAKELESFDNGPKTRTPTFAVCFLLFLVQMGRGMDLL